MPKFLYYVYDQFDGEYKGTNDKALALQYAASPEFPLLDPETGTWQGESGEVFDVAPLARLDDSE